MKYVLSIVLVAAVAAVALVRSPEAGGQGEQKVVFGADDWAGPWTMYEFPDRPNAIFRQGSVLLAVNWEGSIGVGHLKGDVLTIKNGAGWQIGLTGTLVEDRKMIRWSNGTEWIRPKP